MKERSLQQADEQQLARWASAALEGDDVAVNRLVRATQPAVWRLCCALGSPGATDDLVQDTYVRALTSLGTYRGEAPVTVWLLSIARRVCADDVRRRTRGRRMVDRLTRHTTPAESVAPAAHDVASDEGFFADHGALFDALDPDRREAFVLTQVLGFEYAAAAEVMGCPIGTVRSRVARARADLMEMVTRREMVADDVAL